ncbi:uncharacterized protein LOC118439221 [Folsomia candida]|uniref:uncharacterized protein LOC118439221 n=1 Tax=Folsomia candida TaxID=158441 RepID=UPI00160525B7|nr:uncharacterized protein LOC118439221 [Folsomia candida]
MITLQVELYPDSGVFLPSSDLAAIKIASNKPTVLARNLFRRLFSIEEMSSHSLFGKKCNANQGQVPLPEIDVGRRNAVINYVLKEEGFDAPPTTGNIEADGIFLKAKKTTHKEISKSLTELLRQEHKQRVISNYRLVT